MEGDVAPIAKQFDLQGDPYDIAPIPAGHINDTYVLTTRAGETTARYVLQRINHHVFRDPPGVMANIVRVTEHLCTRLTRIDPGWARRQLRVIPTRDGQGCHRDPAGNFWRMYPYIENAVTYDTAPSVEMAREAARMFALFQGLLRDLPPAALHETIPGFHDALRRLEHFRRVLDKDAFNRAQGAAPEIAFVLEHAAICDVLPNRIDAGDLPIRIAHNDAKINNVMVDESTGDGVCVIDLDTVMPGLSLYDFGDLVRTASCLAAEDERDLSKVTVDRSLFEALVEGFAQESHSWLSAAEREHLVFGAILITFEQMIRFLTDHLAGDVYYKVHREDHNLDRARTQMKLVQSILSRKEPMNQFVKVAFRDSPGRKK